MRYRFTALLIIAATFWSSCTKAEPGTGDGQQEGKAEEAVETADMAVSFSLEGGEAISSERRVALAQRIASTAEVNLYLSSKMEAVADGATASFGDVIVPEEGSACYFGAVYPATTSDRASDGMVYLTLPPEQTPSAEAPDAAATLFAGICRDKFAILPSKLEIGLSPLCAYGKITVCGLELEEDETLLSALVTAEGKELAGSLRYDTVTDEADYSSEASTNSVSLLLRSVEPSSEAFDLWFACKPFTLEAEDSVVVHLSTDRRVISATFIPEQEMEFRRGQVCEFSIAPEEGGEPSDDIIIPDSGYSVTGDTWYVSVDGDDDNSGTAPSDAFKTFEKVLTKIGPGDQVRIMPGTYETTAWNGNIDLKKEHSGTPGNYISFVAHDIKNRPVLHAGGKGVWQAININASYIVIDGLEVCGDNQKINLQDAYDFAKKYYDTGSCDWGEAAVFNTNGISAGATGAKTGVPHHVIIRNCIIHDMPGGGAGAIQGDYITIEYNTIYNCAWYTMYGCSGISYLTPINTDDYTGYKMIVRGNKVFNCRTDVPWVRKGVSFNYSDGNGIIIDVNATPDGAGPGKDQGEYRGRTLVINNISVNNGGSGIHAYKANHVDIVGNTAYHNGHKYDGSYGEIWAHQGGDVHIYNNIMYSRPGGKCNLGNGAEYTNNVYFNGQVKIQGKGDLVADPMFVNLSKDIFEADFHLTAGSPAIGYGATDMNYLPEFDHDFHSRAERFDCGAYQYIGKRDE